MVAGSRPLAAPDNLMDGAPEERNSSPRRWGWVRKRGGRWIGEEKQQKKNKNERENKREKKSLMQPSEQQW